MNTRTRYLVLDAKNNPQRPCDAGLRLPDVQSAKSPSILNATTAKTFAGMLAKRNKGQRYYVVQVLGGAEAFDRIEGQGETTDKVALVWEDAAADGEVAGE